MRCRYNIIIALVCSTIWSNSKGEAKKCLVKVRQSYTKKTDSSTEGTSSKRKLANTSPPLGTNKSKQMVSKSSGVLGTYRDVDFNKRLPLPLRNNLKQIGIGRTGLFTRPEMQYARIDPTSKYNISVVNTPSRILKDIPKGALVDINNRGAVIVKASPNIDYEKSEKLFKNFKNQGDIDRFTLKRKKEYEQQRIQILDEALPAKSETEFINNFVKVVTDEVGLTKDNADYLLIAINEMVASGRKLSFSKGSSKKKIQSIRIRWKQGGLGNDFSTLHRDAGSFFVSTLIIKGNGTEWFQVKENNIEVSATKVHEIAHLMGGDSPHPILHRGNTTGTENKKDIKGVKKDVKDTKDAQRLVILIFWG